MSGAEMTYNELLASPDLEKAVRGIPDKELVQVRGWLAQGERCGWPAERVHGMCIVEGCRRFEERLNRQDAKEEKEIRIQISVFSEEKSGVCDRCHGSEVGL